jgi:hypothetical protein
MIGDVSLRSPALPHMRAAQGIARANWKRRTIEVLVSLLAFAVWGLLAYKGFFRLLARMEGVLMGGNWILDLLSLMVGVSGSVAGISALWALAMRATGRTPASLVGAPDDGPDDLPPRRR